MEIGASIAGRYRVERLAGMGGMGSVYQGRDLETGDRVAIKLTQATDREYVERFAREARALAELLAELDHPSIVEYIDHGITADGIPYLVIEWLEGRDLKQRILDRPLTEAETVSVGAQLASALSAVHGRGIIHRDIKPSNIILPDDDLERVKLIDFGLVRLRHQPSKMATQIGRLLGTPSFMAPEQGRGAKDLDARVDLYALGSVLFTCLTQRPPFMGQHAMAILAKLQLEPPPSLRVLRPDVSPALAELIHQLLAKEPAERPASAAVVVERLSALENARPPARSGNARTGPVRDPGDAQATVLLIGMPESPSGNESTPEGDALALEPLAAIHDATVKYLPGDMVLVLFARAADPAEAASRAARFALALRERLPSIPMAMATAASVNDEPVPVGPAIDRAVAMLPHGDATLLNVSDTQGEERERLIAIDEQSAALLGGAFAMDIGAGGQRVLRAETEPEPAVPSAVLRDPSLVP